ncbi:hypothetical protein [Geitlerinema sp. PCC 9228]|uniref:hypothetical protein n=1 Tax=Geitlerinema sp. PCC 9228 TaxID=111611 RepID=UPI0008F990BF|nr:hypothetical protein [Geitlerinema sp. PCC 9228]
MTNWIKINYERDKQVYVIDLDRICAFSLSWNGRLTIYLNNSDTHLTITMQSDPEAYEQIVNYIKEKTGYTLP